MHPVWVDNLIYKSQELTKQIWETERVFHYLERFGTTRITNNQSITRLKGGGQEESWRSLAEMEEPSR